MCLLCPRSLFDNTSVVPAPRLAPGDSAPAISLPIPHPFPSKLSPAQEFHSFLGMSSSSCRDPPFLGFCESAVAPLDVNGGSTAAAIPTIPMVAVSSVVAGCAREAEPPSEEAKNLKDPGEPNVAALAIAGKESHQQKGTPERLPSEHPRLLEKKFVASYASIHSASPPAVATSDAVLPFCAQVHSGSGGGLRSVRQQDILSSHLQLQEPHETQQHAKWQQALQHPGRGFFDYDFYSSLQEFSDAASGADSAPSSTATKQTSRTTAASVVPIGAADVARVTGDGSSSVPAVSSPQYPSPASSESFSPVCSPDAQTQQVSASPSGHRSASALPSTGKEAGKLVQQTKEQEVTNNASLTHGARDEERDDVMVAANTVVGPNVLAPQPAASSEAAVSPLMCDYLSASPSGMAAAPCMQYLPPHSKGAKPLACRSHRCEHAFPPSELKLLLMDGEAAASAAAAAREEEEETVLHPCPLQMPTHLIYHVYEDMNQWQIDRSVAIEAFHQQKLREAYYVLLSLVKRYGVDRVAADTELSLVYSRYTEMVYLLRLLDLDGDTGQQFDGAAAVSQPFDRWGAAVSDPRTENVVAATATARSGDGNDADAAALSISEGGSKDEKRRATTSGRVPSRRPSLRESKNPFAMRSRSSFSKRASPSAASPPGGTAAEMSTKASGGSGSGGQQLSHPPNEEGGYHNMRRSSCNSRDVVAKSTSHHQGCSTGGLAGGENYAVIPSVGTRLEGPLENKVEITYNENTEFEREHHSSSNDQKHHHSLSSDQRASPAGLVQTSSISRVGGGKDTGCATPPPEKSTAATGGGGKVETTVASRLKSLGSTARLQRHSHRKVSATRRRSAQDGDLSRNWLPQQHHGNPERSCTSCVAQNPENASGPQGSVTLQPQGNSHLFTRTPSPNEGATTSPQAAATGDDDHPGASGTSCMCRSSWVRRYRRDEKRRSVVSHGTGSSSLGSFSPLRRSSVPAELCEGGAAAASGEREVMGTSLTKEGTGGERGLMMGRRRGSSSMRDRKSVSRSLSARASLLFGVASPTAATTPTTPIDRGASSGRRKGGSSSSSAGVGTVSPDHRAEERRDSGLGEDVPWGEKESQGVSNSKWWFGAEERAAEEQLKERMKETPINRFTALLYELLEDKEAWHVGVDDGPAIKVWSRSGGSSKTAVIFKMVGLVESSLLCVLSVLNEQDLFKEWVPYFTFPVRDLCVQVWAADDLDVTGQYFVRIVSCEEGENVNGVIAPPSEPGTERLPCEGLLVLQPLSPDTVDVTALFLIDPHVSLPDYFQSFMTRVFARMAFHAFRRVCAAAQFEQHANRRLMRPYLYSFINNRVRALEAAHLLFVREGNNRHRTCGGTEHADADAAHLAHDGVCHPSSPSFAHQPTAHADPQHAAIRFGVSEAKKQEGREKGFLWLKRRD